MTLSNHACAVRRKLAKAIIPTSHARMTDSTIPLRSQRQVCYMARDVFFKCCDRNYIENPLRDIDDVQRLCKGEMEKFDKDCISTWVCRNAELFGGCTDS